MKRTEYRAHFTSDLGAWPIESLLIGLLFVTLSDLINTVSKSTKNWGNRHCVGRIFGEKASHPSVSVFAECSGQAYVAKSNFVD